MNNLRNRALTFAGLFIILSLALKYFTQGKILPENIIGSCIGGAAGAATIYFYNRYISKK